jgi:hypothetical protein
MGLSNNRVLSVMTVLIVEIKMKHQISRVLTVGLAGIFLFCVGMLVPDIASAQSVNVMQKGKKLGNDLQQIVQSNPAGRVDVILQVEGRPSSLLNALLNRSGVRIRAKYYNFNYVALSLPTAFVSELASFPEVSYVSVDRPVQSFGHVTATTGADSISNRQNAYFLSR